MSQGVVTPRRWRDAETAARTLIKRPAERRTVLLLGRLPLLPEAVLERLVGLRSGASVYRTLRHLANDGLVAALHPPVQPGHGPGLWYLTDLGLVTNAVDQGVDPEYLARHNRLRGADLLALQPGLPQLLAAYELLGALAAARPGPVQLLDWQRPWRRRYLRPTAKAPVAATLPAFAALAWEDAVAACLLLPDLGTTPLRLSRPVLDHLFVLRRLQDEVFPTLVIATTATGRAAAWWTLVEEVRRARSEAPLAATIATWDALRSSPGELAHVTSDPYNWRQLSRRVWLRPLRTRQADRPLPRLVGDDLLGSATQVGPAARLGLATLHLAALDRELVDFVARHPFLPLDRLAVVFDSSVAVLRRRCTRLIRLGLLRFLGLDEVREGLADGPLVEATADGLAVVAAQQGLTLAVAVRANGLAGGGPEQPIGPRRQLMRRLAHTLGADAIFVDLIATMRRLAAAGENTALVAWQNAAACSHGHVRPDGYGVYRHHGCLYGFFLEYDRNTMAFRDYCAKFGAYFHYLASGRYARDYDGFPTILVVTRDSDAEERVAFAARAASVGRGETLPLLLTCRSRIEVSSNRNGFLGRIWRTQGGDGERHRPWFWSGNFPPITG